MDNNNKFTDIRTPQPDPAVTPDKAFSDSVGTPAAPVETDKPANTSPKHKAPIGAIILAVIVAGALAATTIFTYRQTNKPAANESNPATTETVSDSDVDKTSEEIDSTLNEMDSASDFVESELSDAALGL